MNIISKPSPNFDARDGQAIDMLVLHYTGMQSGANAIDRLCDPTAKVSAHYVVEEDGSIYQLVPEEQRAWHAGKSFWRGNSNINQRSIGIEIVNPGHEFGYRPFPQKQMDAVAELCKEILARHKIPARNVVAHSDIAPERKEDPGELFDWKFLAEHGVGVWREPNRNVNLGLIGRLGNMFLGKAGYTPIPLGASLSLTSLWQPPLTDTEKMAVGPLASEDELKKSLENYGYDCTNLPKTIMAFQRHWFPKRLTGKWDRECALILHSLLDSAH